MNLCIRTMCICLALTTGMRMQSQYFEKDTIPSDMMKHILFADVTPAVAFAIQAEGYDPIYTLGYKHQINPNKRLRAQLQYQYESSQSGFASVGVNDSTSLWYNSQNEMNQLQLRLGMEWGNYESRVAPFYALDIVAGHNWDMTSRKLYLGEVFENAYQLSDSEADTIVLTLPRLGELIAKDELGYELLSLEFGIAVTIGLRLEMAPHWESWLQMSPEILYVTSYRMRDTVRGIEYGSSGNSSVDFRFKLLNFGLAYKF